MGLKVSTLHIEITRKCNKRCIHCMRGEPQSISMSKEIIDKLFEDVDDCKSICFDGGEVLLEIELLDYFIEKIIKHNWNTEDIQLTTNGIILDSRIVDIYDKFCKSRENRFALLRFSDDVFHDRAEFENGFNYYQPLIDEKNCQYGNKGKIVYHFAFNDIYEKSNDRINSDLPYIVYTGRGKDYVDNNRNIFTPFGTKPVQYPYKHNHRIKIEKDTVFCALRLCANGNVVFAENTSYEIDDEISMGNILKNNITDILLQHNNKCLLRCEEASKITYGEKFRDFVPNISENERISLNVISLVYKNILKTRKLARELYPYIPAQDIIDNIPTPTDFETSRLAGKIQKRYCKTLQTNEFISKVDDNIMKKFISDYKELPKREMDYRLQLLVVKIVLENNDMYMLAHDFFDTKEGVLRCNTFKILTTLNDKYKTGVLQFTNDKVFFCNGM